MLVISPKLKLSIHSAGSVVEMRTPQKLTLTNIEMLASSTEGNSKPPGIQEDIHNACPSSTKMAVV
jgi:hypothetical protein